jgi:hypothetical protein
MSSFIKDGVKGPVTMRDPSALTMMKKLAFFCPYGYPMPKEKALLVFKFL